MAMERLKTGDTPYIRVNSCEADLVVRGWNEAAVKVSGDYDLQEDTKGISLTGKGSLNLNIPVGATLSVGRVGGDLVIKNFTGPGSYELVQGDAALSGAGETEIGTVKGDLAARRLLDSFSASEVNGDVIVRSAEETVLRIVHGDVSARHVNGNLTIEAIHGDADLRNVEGDVKVSKSYRDVNLTNILGEVNIIDVKGDVRLRGLLSSGDHRLESQGDIIVRWPAGSPLNLVAAGRQIDNRLPLEDAVEKDGTLSGKIGNGSTNLNLVSAGRIVLKLIDGTDDKWNSFRGDMEFEFDVEMAGVASRIEAEVNSHISRVTRDLESKFGADFGQRFAEKAARKMEKAGERARRKAEPRGRSSGADFSSTPSAPAKKAATTEEQLKILKMVETGKISPEEASMLLEAMEV